MCAKTRINRPTYATLKHRGKMIHQSTHYVWLPITGQISGPARFVKVSKGSTYRRAMS